MNLTTEQIRKISSEATKIAQKAQNDSCEVTAALANAIVAAALRGDKSGDALAGVLLAEKVGEEDETPSKGSFVGGL